MYVCNKHNLKHSDLIIKPIMTDFIKQKWILFSLMKSLILNYSI